MPLPMPLQFVQKDMPLVAAHLHYRILDVSTIKELARRWYPRDLDAAPAKRYAHTALSDIEDSIEELRFYRRSIFKKK